MKLLAGQSFWRKLLLFGMLLGTFPVIAVGMFSYYMAADKVGDMAESGNRQILLQTEQRVEQTFRTLDTAVTQFISSPDTGIAMNVSMDTLDFQSVKRFDQLVSSMHHLQTFEFGVHDVYLIQTNNRWLIRNDGIYSLDRLKPSDQAQIDRYTSIKGGSVWMKDDFVVNSAPADYEDYEENEPTSSQYDGGISLVKKLADGQGFIAAKISRGELEKLLLKSSKLGSIMLLDGSGRMIAYQQGEEAAAKAVQSQPWQDRLKSLANSDGIFPASISGEKMMVTYRKSDYNGFMYVSVQSAAAFSRQSAVIGWVTLAACVAVLAIIVVLALLGSRRMYSPIRKLHDEVLGLGQLRTSQREKGRDELQRIGERFLSVTQSQERMAAELRSQLGQLEDFFVMRLCLGEVKESELAAKRELSLEARSWRTCCVTAFQVESFVESKYGANDRELLTFAVGNIVSESIPADRRFSPLLMGRTVIVIVGSCDAGAESFKHEIYSWAETAQRAVADYLQLQVNIGVSRFYDKLAETSIAYKQSLDALAYRATLGRQSILFIEDMYPETAPRRPFSAVPEKDLLEAVKSGETDLVYEHLDRYLDAIANAGLPPLEVQSLLMRLVAGMIALVQEAGLSVASVYGGQPLFDQLLKLHSMQDIGHWLRTGLIRPVTERLEQQRNTQFRKISGELIRIIQERYDTDLSLESCAEAVHYNPHYVSRVFRQETGMTFSEYVSRHRLTVAKKWLRETDMKIGEISDRLRYATTTNFIRQFRKVEQMTPGQYRQNHAAGQLEART